MKGSMLRRPQALLRASALRARRLLCTAPPAEPSPLVVVNREYGDGVASIQLCNKPVNALTQAVAKASVASSAVCFLPPDACSHR